MQIPVIPPEPFDMPNWTQARRKEMFRAALKLQGISSSEIVIEALDKTYSVGASLQELDQAWKELEIPEIKALTWRWRITMAVTAMHIQSACMHLERNLGMYSRHAAGFPYWRVSMILDSCRRSPHAWLDGFAAKWNDDVWKFLTPPFGWECGCIISMVSDSSVPLGLEPLQPGIERVPDDVLRGATEWMDESPDYLWDRSIAPTRPYVPAEPWPDDPSRMGPTDEQRALLRHYGISVEIVHKGD